MKRKNYNALVFFAAAVLIVTGWCSKSFIKGMLNAGKDLVRQKDVSAFIRDVDEASKKVSYHPQLLNAASLTYRFTDTRVVEKTDATVVRMDNDYLCLAPKDRSDWLLTTMTEETARLKALTDQLGIPLVYTLAPHKYHFGTMPATVPNPSRADHAQYVSLLQDAGINVLDLTAQMEQQGLTMEETFFITDHHWLPQTGIWATDLIGQELSRQGIPYDPATTDLTNYKIKTYKDHSLGSEGKKVGRYFTPLGLDDIDLITPAFPTHLTVTDTRGTLTGDFSETLIAMDALEPKDLYGKSCYEAYSAGNFPLQIIENHNAPESGPRLLVLRDSFACAVTPYLSLNARSTHIIDLRYWEGDDQTPTLADYLRQGDFDGVLILYGTLSPEFHEFFGPIP